MNIEDQVRAVLAAHTVDEQLHEMVKDVVRRIYKDDGVHEVRTGTWPWFCMISAIQLAARHPTAADTPVMQQAIKFAHSVGDFLVEDDPELEAVIEMGWDVDGENG